MERTCENCKHDGNKERCEQCVVAYDKVPSMYECKGNLTNADYIRAMSDEELAEFIDNNVKNSCDFCDCDVKEKNYHSNADCIRGITKWLQQPRKVEE